MTWETMVGFSEGHFDMLLMIEEALWESSMHTDDEVKENYKEIQQAHQHIKDAIAILEGKA